MTSIRGLAYPLQVQNGSLALVEDAASVEQQIISVLETRPFERIMRADYGLMDDTFETVSPAAIDSKISDAITQQVGGIEDLSVRGNWTNGDSGLYSVVIVYTIQGTPQPPLSLSLVV
jgi:hypothetical protein